MSRRKWFQALVVTAVAAFLLAWSGPASAQGNSDNAFERVKEVQERHTEKVMAGDDVVGTAVGFNEQGEHAVLVFLERSGVAGIPQELEGVPVHPLVTGKIEALKPPTKPTRPTDPFIKAGDSGSLLVTEARQPVSLLFAGDNGGKFAVANPIDDVLDALGVSIDGQ